MDGLYGCGEEFATGQGDVADGYAAVDDGEVGADFVEFDDAAPAAVVVAPAAAVATELVPVPGHC